MRRNVSLTTKDTTVKCASCGRVEHVNAGNCLRNGWPACCEAKMAKAEAPGDVHVAVTKALEKLG